MYLQYRKHTVSKEKGAQNSMKKEIGRQIDELGRLVIPKDFRKLYGLKGGTTVYFTIKDDGILIHTEDYLYDHEKNDCK